jgi:hypothetical protein
MTLRVVAALILFAGCMGPPPNRSSGSGSDILPDRLYFVHEAAPSLGTVRRAIDAAIAGHDTQLAYVIALVRYTDGEGGESYGDSLNDLQHAVTPQRFQRILATLDPKVREQATVCMGVAQQIRQYVRGRNQI